jgi:hypothetical protein
MSDLPDYARNMRLVGHSDQGGLNVQLIEL